jgi:hypothetical protein
LAICHLLSAGITEQFENLALWQLRHLVGQMDRIDHSMDEIKHRLISLEGGVQAIRRDVLGIQVDTPQDLQKAQG